MPPTLTLDVTPAAADLLLGLAVVQSLCWLALLAAVCWLLAPRRDGR